LFKEIIMIKTRCWGIPLCLALTSLGHAEGLLAIDNPAKIDQVTKVYAVVDAFEANDQVAMREYGASWQGNYTPRSGTNIGLLAARAEAGVQWNGYRFGALYRAEALVEANRDTADVVQQYSTQSGYNIGRTYALDYRIKGFEANGARVSKSMAFVTGSPWQVQVGAGLSYLRGTRLKIETVTGQIVTLNTKDFGAAAGRNMTDSTLNVSDLAQFNAPAGRMAAPSGSGYALDFGVVARHPDSGITLELAVADLLGRIEWTDVPNNVTAYNNATKYYDANGYAQFNALTTRTSNYQTISQQLDPKIRLAVSYPVGHFQLQGAADYTQGYWFPQLAVTYPFSPRWLLKADVDLRFQTVGLMLQHPWLYVGFRTDALDAGAAKAYGLTAGVHFSF